MASVVFEPVVAAQKYHSNLLAYHNLSLKVVMLIAVVNCAAFALLVAKLHSEIELDGSIAVICLNNQHNYPKELQLRFYSLWGYLVCKLDWKGSMMEKLEPKPDYLDNNILGSLFRVFAFNKPLNNDFIFPTQYLKNYETQVVENCKQNCRFNLFYLQIYCTISLQMKFLLLFNSNGFLFH
jgi:hypothetical protein